MTMALTATASRTQAGEIRELLHLTDPVTVTTDADRPNLRPRWSAPYSANASRP